MSDTPEFQVGDIVEVLNLNPRQCEYLPNHKDFIGMRYAVEKIILPRRSRGGQLITEDSELMLLKGFPKNAVGFSIFFKPSQLLLYQRIKN